MNNTKEVPTLIDYRERQEQLNTRYSHRVEAWLSHFKVDYV